jgi:hypothetical protein
MKCGEPDYLAHYQLLKDTSPLSHLVRQSNLTRLEFWDMVVYGLPPSLFKVSNQLILLRYARL